MLQSLPQFVPPLLPDIIRAARITYLPNIMQTRTAKGDDAKEVVEEMCERMPAEVCMFRRVLVSLENPVGWYLGNLNFLLLVVARGVGSRCHDCGR